MGTTVSGDGSKYRCVVKAGFQKTSLYQKEYVKIKDNIIAIIITVFLGPRGGRKRAVPAISVDIVRGGRKGDPQYKVVGETVGGEDSKYCPAVKVGFQKTSLYLKGNR